MDAVEASEVGALGRGCLSPVRSTSRGARVPPDRDWHLAEDLAQEAFIWATGRLQHLREPQRFDAYLNRVVVNLHRSVIRRRRVEGR